MNPRSPTRDERRQDPTRGHEVGPHVANAKADARGPRVVKEHRHSRRRIDLAVAAIMAFDRAGYYARRGTPMIYAD